SGPLGVNEYQHDRNARIARHLAVLEHADRFARGICTNQHRRPKRPLRAPPRGSTSEIRGPLADCVETSDLVPISIRDWFEGHPASEKRVVFAHSSDRETACSLHHSSNSWRSSPMTNASISPAGVWRWRLSTPS